MEQDSPSLGFKKKEKTLQEIEQQYSHHAIQASHKAIVIEEQELEIQKVHKEIENHFQQMKLLRAKAKKIPTPPAEITPENGKEETAIETAPEVSEMAAS